MVHKDVWIPRLRVQNLNLSFLVSRERQDGKYFSQEILIRSGIISWSILEVNCTTENGIKWQECAGTTVLLAIF